jgi:hypothetical protein
MEINPRVKLYTKVINKIIHNNGLEYIESFNGYFYDLLNDDIFPDVMPIHTIVSSFKAIYKNNKVYFINKEPYFGIFIKSNKTIIEI